MLSLTQRPLYSIVFTFLLLFSIVINTPSMAGTTGTELPADLSSPRRGVLCNKKVQTCYNSQGVSLRLTQEFMDDKAADRLAGKLSLIDKQFFDQTNFNPVQDVSCHTLEKT